MTELVTPSEGMDTDVGREQRAQQFLQQRRCHGCVGDEEAQHGRHVGLDHAGALADAGDVDEVARLEHVGAQLLAHLVVGGGIGVGEPQLGDVATRGDTGLGELARDGLVHLAGVDRAEGELHGVVAVVGLGTDLGDHVRPGLDDGDRDDPVVLVEDLGHAELGAQDALDLGVTHLFTVSAARCLLTATRSEVTGC